MKKLLFIFFAMLCSLSAVSQDSYIVLEAQYDSFGPSESQFFITSAYGDTVYHHQPVEDSEYLYDTLFISSQSLTITLLDSYGDGWQDSNIQGYFRAWNMCQDTIVEYLCNPSNGFATEIIPFNLGPCQPNAPPAPCVPAIVIINLDQYQGETSWEIADTTGMVVSSGGGYGNSPDYASITQQVCIPAGPLTFTIMDSYGDGLEGSLWQGQDGSYFLQQCNDTLVYGSNPAFGTDTIHSFVSDTCPPIPGCLDPLYIEYNPFATANDSTCYDLKVFGCIDSSMYNYDPLANTMEMTDSCTFKLTLHDLVGNGWIGSSLKIYASGDTTEYTHTGGFNDIYYIDLSAPTPITAQFFINNQASLTTIECGFTISNLDGDTIISIQPPFIQPLLPYNIITNCGNECIEKVYGCTYSTAINYNSSANTDDVSCYYNPGCTSPTYLEYDLNYDYDDGSCSTLVVLGCMDSLAFNYNSLANTELTGSCIAIIEGCMNPLAFNYNLNANVDDSGCIPLIYGCTDVTMFNYNVNANTDDSSCIPFVYGCTDSTMFNFNPLANANNNTCIPFVYGCTDPSMLNYNPQANSEDFSCLIYIYGCTDDNALNYDSMANTDNGTCIEIIEGCMDQNAFNYNFLANVSDSLCLYDAGCITGPGEPYWLNDPCYAWVIDVDGYCCSNLWDPTCQSMYNYCEQGWPIGIDEPSSLGIIVYPNPTEGILNIDTRLNISVQIYNMNGKLMTQENSNRIDFSKWPSGMYNLLIRKDKLIITKRIIKQ